MVEFRSSSFAFTYAQLALDDRELKREMIPPRGPYLSLSTRTARYGIDPFIIMNFGKRLCPTKGHPNAG